MVEITLILDTQTPEAMRVITNDNMELLVSQINQILDYMDTDFGSITGLSNLETSELKVATNKLVITASSSTLNDNFVLNGSLTTNGNVIRANIYNTLINNQHPDVIANGGEYNIGNTTSYPIYSTYRVSSSDPSGLTVNLFPGNQGQEVFIVMSNDPSGVETFVSIQNSPLSNGEFYLPSIPTGLTSVRLDDIGQVLHLMYVNDGWVIINAANFSYE